MWTGRLESSVIVLFLMCAGLHALSVRFPHFSNPKHRALLHKRGSGGNPCPADKPFLCKVTPKCIPLEYVCDGNFDCDGGFDENEAVCNAANRPPVEELWEFLEKEHSWILPKLFDGIDAEFVAHSLAVSPDVHDVQLVLGLSDTAVNNIKTAFKAVEDGDERPLEAMGMPENEWHTTEYMLDKLIKSGFKVKK
ncbi:neuropeptide prohormone-4-like [Liolophura sinensis]|uniref:neuropeptide prohormone-4-like n=1 Tax=Liolophura sinensis TaxID=3198878 RepID=UPI003159702B